MSARPPIDRSLRKFPDRAFRAPRGAALLSDPSGCAKEPTRFARSVHPVQERGRHGQQVIVVIHQDLRVLGASR